MSKTHRILDALSLMFSLSIIAAAAVWLWYNGTFSLSIMSIENPTWMLIRSAGVTSYILLTVSVMWGLMLSSRAVKDWSPGVLSMLLHSTISWLALIFGLAHGLLLMFDNYVPYQFHEVFVPFVGPYRPLEVGFGTISFWIVLVVVLSFPLKRFIGVKTWRMLHFTSYLAFLMSTLHGLLAGTDADSPGFQIMMGVTVFTVLLLSAYRVFKALQRSPRPSRSTAESTRSRRAAPQMD